MIELARQAVPRGTPCADCGKPIRTAAHPKGWQRKYCDRLRCRRARVNRVSLAFYHRQGPDGAARQRERYDPAKRHARYAALTDAQRRRRLVQAIAARRRRRRAHPDLWAAQVARAKAKYDPAVRHALYLATGT